MRWPSALSHALLTSAVLAFSAPAFGQIDISGEWAGRLHEDQPRREPGATIGDWAGIPLNAAARLNAEAWDPAIISIDEHQGWQYSSTLAFYAPGNARIAKQIEDRTQRLIAYAIDYSIFQMHRTIWMDGRPHPPDFAAHTWMGFSTGRWDGRTLVVETTHLKAGYLERNGVRHTDRATMTERFTRHGNFLTVISIVDDPDVLDEPFVQSRNFALDPDQQLPPRASWGVVMEMSPRGRGYVPHYLPGRNPFLHEFADKMHIPFEATRGGRETMYPEYGTTLRRQPVGTPVSNTASH